MPLTIVVMTMMVVVVMIMAGVIMLVTMRMAVTRMIMGGGMTVPVVMIVAMRIVIVAVMIMAVMGMTRVMMVGFGERRRRAGIGAAFRIERRLDLDDAPAEPPNHLGDDVIEPDAQTARGDLGGQMAVAEMPGDSHQMLRIRAADLEQRFGGCDDFDQPSVLQHQGVTAAQRHGLFEVEQKNEPAGPLHGETAPVPVVEPEHDAVGGFSRPTGAEHLKRANHSRLPGLPVTAHRPWPA